MPVTTDIGRVRSILNVDRAWSAYALADLAPPYADKAEWHCPEGRAPALALLYRGFDPPVLVTVGAAEHLDALLGEIAAEPGMYVSVPETVAAMLTARGFTLQRRTAIRRMLLDADSLGPVNFAAVPLRGADYAELAELYDAWRLESGGPTFFSRPMLESGVYYGLRVHGRLVAAAGTHVFAPTEGVAGVGNVYTRREFRRRGYGGAVTAAVAAESVRSGVETVVLNVASENTAAIKVYERLGFAMHCEYIEGIAIGQTPEYRYKNP